MSDAMQAMQVWLTEYISSGDTQCSSIQCERHCPRTGLNLTRLRRGKVIAETEHDEDIVYAHVGKYRDGQRSRRPER